MSEMNQIRRLWLSVIKGAVVDVMALDGKSISAAKWLAVDTFDRRFVFEAAGIDEPKYLRIVSFIRRLGMIAMDGNRVKRGKDGKHRIEPAVPADDDKKDEKLERLAAVGKYLSEIVPIDKDEISVSVRDVIRLLDRITEDSEQLESANG